MSTAEAPENNEPGPLLGLGSSAGLGPVPVLSACPFCGKALVVAWRRINPWAKCKTEDCWGAKSVVVALDIPEQVTAWNTRHYPGPIAIMDTRTSLAVCAVSNADFLALYALQGRRVALVDLGPNVGIESPYSVGSNDGLGPMLAKREE